MAVTLKPKPNHPNGSFQKSKHRKNYIKLGQMCRFCTLFSSIAMAWCIMNSYNKDVRSIRNTTLKLCSNWGKQFVRNTHHSGKTNQGFCTSSHIDVCAWAFAKKKTVIITQPPYSLDLVPSWHLTLQKTWDIDERKAFCYDWGLGLRKNRNRSCWRYQKNTFQRGFEDWKKRWHKFIISEGGYFEGAR